jgi:hypothetical protein
MSCRSVVGHDLLSQTCMSVASPTGPRRLRSARALLCSGSGWLVVQSELRTVLGARGTHHLGHRLDAKNFAKIFRFSVTSNL